jgi:hypothetical protein
VLKPIGGVRATSQPRATERRKLARVRVSRRAIVQWLDRFYKSS